MTTSVTWIPYAPYYGAWSRPGFLYSPWGYTPYFGLYGYDPFGSYAYYGSRQRGGWNDDDDDRDGPPTGSLRLRASPNTAKVYIDGALAGIVDDFDGLSGHLRIEVGRHQLELRADGYLPYSTEISIGANRTRTERVTLKKR